MSTTSKMIKIVLLSMASMLAIALSGCGGGGGGGENVVNAPANAVKGGGVKGPLANAIVRLYQADLTRTDLMGGLLGEGVTGSDAAINDLTVDSGLSGLVLLEFVADAATTDIGTGMAPVINRLTTVVDVQRIYNGDAIYATPLTNMAVSLAQANADKGAPYAGNSDLTITIGEFTAALAVAQNQVKSTLGFGLDSSVDIFAVPPILTADMTTAEEQAQVVKYRAAIEAIAALTDQVASDSSASDTPQEIFEGLTEDLKDGTIDGLNDTTPVSTLAALDTPIDTTLGSLDPTTLVIPNTTTPITDIKQTMSDELATTGEAVDTTPLAAIEVNPAPPALVAESNDTYSVGGTLSGLSGTVVLQNNAGDDLTLSANGGYSFAAPVADGNAYNVTVLTQPSGQTCAASSNSGTVSASNVTSISVSCTTNTYTIGGGVSGLSGSVVLQNNGGDDLTVNGDGDFTFNTSVAYGNTYNVSVLTQPPGQTCTASTNSGTVGSANVTTVAVTCSTNAYTIGGSVTGLSGSVVLQNNSGDNLTVNSDGDFTFNTAIADGSSYSVTVLTQPVGQTCVASGNTGSVSGANVTTVAVTCATYHSIGGTLSGLPYLKTVTLQLNGGNNLVLNNNGPFQFATPIADGGSYSVTVSNASAGLDCTAANNTGTVNGDFVRDVVVTCTTQTHTVGGSVTGLSGSLMLQNNGGDDLTINANGSFTFNTAVAYATAYHVTVLTQPTGQTCAVSNGVGVMSTTDVTDVTVTCTTNSYTVGGTVSGLSGSVVLQNNGGDDLAVNANGQFVFATSIIHGGSYSVSVLTQPSGQTCVASNSSGTVNGARVNNIAITCTDHSYTIGGNLSGLSGSVVLQNNGGDDLTLNADGDFTFNTAIINGGSYNVTVLTQSAGQTCTASSNTGSVSAANVSNVAVTCSANSYTIGGTVSGLSGSVVLQNNGGDDLTLNADTAFTFNTSIADGGSYNVTVLSQPAGQLCTASSNSGVVSGANVATVSISCVSAYSIGGTVSGLTGTLVLQNNNADDLSINADGAFSFSTPVVDTGNYSVAISTQPSNLTCFVGSGSGQVSGADITSVFVFCSSPELDADVISDTVTLDWMDVGASSYNLYYSSASDCDITNYASCANGAMLPNVTPPYTVSSLAVEQNWWFQLESVVTGANGVAQVGVRTSQVSPKKIASAGFIIDHGGLYAITHDASDRTYLGGDFTSMANVSGRGVVASAARADGTATGHARAYPKITGGTVHAAASDDNGGYYIGGNFTEVDGQPHSGLAHILPSGELDPYWTPQADNTVYSIAVAGSTVYVGGVFLNIDGLSHAHLAAIDTNGNLQSWDPGVDAGVLTMQLSGTTLYIGGGFGSVGGDARGKLAAIDTTTGNLTSWTPVTVNNGEVSGLVVYNGVVYFGGNFTQVDSTTRQYLAAVNADGSLAAWNPAPDRRVYSLAISGSTIYAGGDFMNIGGLSSHYNLAAIDAADATVQNWPTGYSLSMYGSTRAIAVNGNTVYVGGNLLDINGSGRNFVAAYGSDGTLQNWDVGVDDFVYALAADNETVFVGGEFNLQGGVARSNLAALEADDSLDLNWAPAANDMVEALAVSGSTLYVGGQFTSIDDGSGAQTRTRLAAIGATDGTLDSNWSPAANGIVYALATDAGGTLYAGGAFTNVNDGSTYSGTYLAAIDSSGNVLSGWAPSADDEVYAVTVSGSTIYVGGNFYNINSTPRSYVAAIGTDGTLGSWSPIVDGFYYYGDQLVSDILVSGSTVYIAGCFSSIDDKSGGGAVYFNSLAAVGSDGSLINWVTDPLGYVYDIALSGTTLYAAGQFTAMGADTRNNAAAVNTSDGSATSLDPNLDSMSYAVDAHNGKVYFGGDFATQNGTPSPLLLILPE